MKLFFILVVVISNVSLGKCIKITFDDLNDDVIMETFDKINFTDLLGVADTNIRFRDLIIQRYMIPKYHLNDKHIKLQLFTQYNYKIKFNYQGDLEINDHNLLLKFLRNFGHLVSHISFDFSNPEWYQRIGSYINQYCSESLAKLEISNANENFYLEWNKPFKNVSVFVLYGSSKRWDCENNTMNFPEIFPSLQHFDVSRMSFSNSKCIDFYFPNIKHIEFDMYAYQNYTQKMYENIFDLNPQLQSISITGMNSYNVLRMANEKLDNLEALNIVLRPKDFEQYDGETIYFTNVKRLYIRFEWIVFYPDIEQNFTSLKFENLEEIEFDWVSGYEYSENWMEFLVHPLKLKRLTIALRRLNLQEWTSTIEKLPGLEVIKAAWNPTQGTDGIAGVMATDTNLKKVILTEITQTKLNVFKTLIGNQWQFEGELSSFMKEAVFIRRER